MVPTAGESWAGALRPTPTGRRRVVAELLSDGSTWQVAELARRLDVSEATVRRDLHVLERESNVMQRGWGSVSFSTSPVEEAFASKLNTHRAAKEAIARLVADRVRSGQLLCMNGGTTTTFLARAIAKRRVEVTLITNAVNIAHEMAGVGSVHVELLGGTLHHENYELVGSRAVAGLSDLHANVAILGCNGVSTALGASTIVVPEADVSRAMVSRADEVWVVADHSKLGRNSLVSIVPLSGIRFLFTDQIEEHLRLEFTASTDVVSPTDD